MRARVVVGLVVISLVAAVGAAAPGSGAKAVATESVLATGLSITPQIAYERAMLRVTGPKGYHGRQKFEAGAAIQVDLTSFGSMSAHGNRQQRGGREELAERTAMPDGRYKFEVTFMAGGKKAGVHSGMFFVEGGLAVSRNSKRSQLAQVRQDLGRERQQMAAKGSRPQMSSEKRGSGLRSGKTEAPMSTEAPITEGYYFPDYIILQPTAYPTTWLGLVAYDFLTYQYPSMSISNYSGDLRIADYFYPSYFDPYIQDLMTVTRYGNVGIGTTAPYAALDVTGNPQQLSINGYGYYSSVGVGFAGFWLYDDDYEPIATFNHNADAFTLVVDAEGVGVGDFPYVYPYGFTVPAVDLHVKDEDPQLLIESSSGTTTGRTLAYMKNPGDVRMFWENTDSGDIWQMSMLSTVLQMATPTGDGKFRVRKSGGLQALNGSTEIMALNSTGDLTVKSVTETSSREAKNGFESVDGLSVLEKVAALPISEWSYKVDNPGVRHLGPMAEDFHAAFGLGKTDKGITSVDTTGVALAAIQGLNQKLMEKNAQLEQRLLELEEMVQALAEH